MQFASCDYSSRESEVTQAHSKLDFRDNAERRKWHSLTPNKTFEFRREHFRVRRNQLIATPPIRNATICFCKWNFRVHTSSQLDAYTWDSFIKKSIFEFTHPLGLYNIKRTEMGGHFECWAAKDSTLCKHCTGPHGPNGIETRNIHVNGEARNIHVNGVTKCDARDWGSYCHGLNQTSTRQASPQISRNKHICFKRCLC